MALIRLLPWALVLFVLVACGNEPEPESRRALTNPTETRVRTSADPELRITRPNARGFHLLVAIAEGMSAHMGPDFERESEVLARATPGQSAVWALSETDAEVNNGGFEQFFFNSAGALIDEARAGAELIGADANTKILQEAAEAFSDGDVPEDREARWRILDSMSEEQSERLSDLDGRWYDQDRLLERRMLAYVEAHPGEFFR